MKHFTCCSLQSFYKVLLLLLVKVYKPMYLENGHIHYYWYLQVLLILSTTKRRTAHFVHSACVEILSKVYSENFNFIHDWLCQGDLLQYTLQVKCFWRNKENEKNTKKFPYSTLCLSLVKMLKFSC